MLQVACCTCQLTSFVCALVFVIKAKILTRRVVSKAWMQVSATTTMHDNKQHVRVYNNNNTYKSNEIKKLWNCSQNENDCTQKI